MLSPTPLSLFCAILLCLPLAIVFTATKPNPATTATTVIISSKTNENPKTILVPTPTLVRITKTHKKKLGLQSNVTSPPPPPPPPVVVSPPPDNDVSIFRLASLANPKPSPSTTSPKKLAFMFLTTTPLPFAPLWELYLNQTNKNLFNIYVHADPRFHYDPPFSGVFARRVMPSKPALRYTPTLVSAARRLLARALLDDPSNAVFALFSPSCVPLHSFNFTYETLMSSDKSFIEILKNERWALSRWAARGEDAMLPEVKFEDFRIGSQFWVLTRKHARLVVSDRRLWSKFNRPCVRQDTCYPEESYFSTLISMRERDPRSYVPATLTHVDWKGRLDGHPRTYRASEVGPELILSLRKDSPRYGDDGTNGSDLSLTKRHDPFLFARKFSFDSIQPLMSIANDVIFID